MKRYYKLVLLISIVTNIACAGSFDTLFSIISVQSARVHAFLMQQNAQQIWRCRVGLGFASGFAVGCANAQSQGVSHVIGMSAAAGASYGLWCQNPLSERDWLDVASAYVVGTFVGRLANKTTKYCADCLRSTFNKPEARVIVTQNDPSA